MKENRFFPKAEGAGLMPKQDRNAWLKGGDAKCSMPPRKPLGKPWHLVLLGVPGVGKGTQAELLSERLACCHLSTGDIFRAAKCFDEKDQTPAIQSALGYMRRGELVPDKTVLRLVGERPRCLSCSGGFLLDGFPRTVAQAEAFPDAASAPSARPFSMWKPNVRNLIAFATNAAECLFSAKMTGPKPSR